MKKRKELLKNLLLGSSEDGSAFSVAGKQNGRWGSFALEGNMDLGPPS